VSNSIYELRRLSAFPVWRKDLLENMRLLTLILSSAIERLTVEPDSELPTVEDIQAIYRQYNP